MDDTKRKAHRKSKVGQKAEKKKAVKQRKLGITKEVRSKNPKAFVFSSAHAALKAQRRSLDLHQKRVDLPVLDQSGTADEVPPIVIAVVGPPQVGKSTLIRSLIKNYTRYSVGDIKGPITIVASKRRRITFVECNNDINSMIDTAKIADLVLLLIDASFGFEMETFEFLNILQTHGFPKVIGILTHLDGFKNNKTLKKTKKKLKDRFWTEIYQGAKLFYLSGMIHGKYPKQEIHNLARFISVAKLIPLSWRNTHPYVYVDRFEDTTDVEQIKQRPKDDRSICLYGYVRGTYLKPHMKVHIPGAGDFRMKSITPLSDPCPLPDERKKVLNGKERLIYAPMGDIGNVLYDKDAVYINLPDNRINFSKIKEGKIVEKDSDDEYQEDGDQESDDEMGDQGVGMVRKLQNTRVGLDEKMEESEVSLFSNSAPIKLKPISNKRRADLDRVDELSDSEYYGGEPEQQTQLATAKSTTKKVEVREIVDGRERRKVKFVQLKKVPTDLASDEEDDDDVNGAAEGMDSDDDQSDEDDQDDDDDGEHKVQDDSDVEGENLRFDDEDDGSDVELDDEEYYDPANEDNDLEGEDEDEDDEDEEEVEVDDDEDEDEEEESSKWKQNMSNHFQASKLINQKVNLAKLIYGDQSQSKKDTNNNDDDEDDDGEFFKVKKGGFGSMRLKKDIEAQQSTGLNQLDSSKNTASVTHTNEFRDAPDVKALLMSRFVDKDELAAHGAVGREGDQDDEVLFGDFEDLETGKKFGPGGKEAGDDDEKDADDSEDEDGDKKGSKKGGNGDKDDDDKEANFDEDRNRNKERKEREIKRINAKYEAEEEDYAHEMTEAVKRQRAINEAEFAKDDKLSRMQYAGFPIGVYVRIEFEAVPYEFAHHFDPHYPLLVGGLQANEENLGMVNVKIKKHRWHKKLLKTNDPLIISMGWRRFQTMMLYSIQDINGRNRMLKYSPEHMHCQGSFYGPMTPPGTGFIAFTQLNSKQASFRVSANGIILDLDSTINVVKKLKLTGRPSKILKKTAFVQGMFTSRLEVAKFVGATVRTVSGIRGQIKKPLSAPEGAYRATFEDKLLMSDIIFLRTWYTIQPTKFYTPVTNILKQDKSEWQGMKTVGQLRYEHGLRAPIKEDSVYREIERPKREYRPMEIPASLQNQLPFDLKPKFKKERNEADALLSHRAVVLEPHEKRVADLMNKLEMIRNKKIMKERQHSEAKRKENQRVKNKEKEKMEERQKEQKKRKFKIDALKSKKKPKQHA
ncbi:hypothetical protein SAMD00019534_071340 [Acytostelium subglobosum LB1]|uniref:hypothetical protein n=1 Tax=Acytostelium subglobosum LB1 TaxID=1410327 RepID=UPI000644982C|nr:hypothetical protein SAMD00019534_071340 [Acytostelium subglobosum LB1]GAM23959.1 hypothetical protein SAMD00019534_071340 [Acytostelium subglobosum LB1]|eukprot:XP_012752995.1 hypothetical protein SAMD00019534_071340 [Acytostelium subglobosum LB1]